MDQSGEPVAKVQCPYCQTRLEVLETQSRGRTVAVSLLGTSVETSAYALETFQSVDAGPQIVCPACRRSFDPSGPYRVIPRLNRAP